MRDLLGMARKLTIGLIAASLLAIVCVSWVANTAAAKSTPRCVTLAISYSADPAAGVRQVQGEEVETEYLMDITACEGYPAAVSRPEFGSIFFDLKSPKGD